MTHDCPRHTPGTYACYTKHGCLCPPCSAAAARYSKRRRHLQACGQPTSLDATPIRRHAQRLVDSGMGISEIERRSGYNRVGIRRILRGDYQRVTIPTARKLLSVKPAPIELHETGKVDPTGTRRRIQALTAAGWTLAAMAEHGNVRKQTLSRVLIAGSVFAATRAEVAALYDALWDRQPPAATTRDRQNRGRALALAARNGWPTPMCWDDDEIDNPAARPHGSLAGRKQHGASAAEVRHLLGTDSGDNIAKRLGYDNLDNLATTIGHTDKRLAARLRAAKEVA